MHLAVADEENEGILPRRSSSVWSLTAALLELLGACVDCDIEFTFAGIDTGADSGMLGHLR
jgi:hypothetical protein